MNLFARHVRDIRPNYEPSKRRITFKNGAIVTCYSAEERRRAL